MPESHNPRSDQGQAAYQPVHPDHQGCTDRGDLGPCDCLCHRDGNVRHTPLAPYDGTDQQVIDTIWGADAVFCSRCVPGMWHHRDYHKAAHRGVR